MSSIGFMRQMTVAASTRRAPGVVAGKQGDPKVHVPTMRCTPLYPASTETARRLDIDAPTNLLEAFTAEADVRDGDQLVVGNKTYAVTKALTWPWRNHTFVHMVLEEVRE